MPKGAKGTLTEITRKCKQCHRQFTPRTDSHVFCVPRCAQMFNGFQGLSSLTYVGRKKPVRLPKGITEKDTY